MLNLLMRPDGRKLSYIDAGPRYGKPVFYFHGIPSAAAEWRMWGSEELLAEVGVRLIAIDRPGVGGSSFQPNRRLSDWPTEVAALADALEIQRFSILSYSGGGPYAAVCAATIPERLTSVGLVSSPTSFALKELLPGITPGNVRFLCSSINKPWLYRLMYRQIGLLARLAPRKYMEQVQSALGEADRASFIQPQVHAAMFAATGTPLGQQWDTRLLVSPWDFRLDNIAVPVYLWHGGEDRNVSPAMGRYLAKAISTSHSAFFPDEGHISLICKMAKEILRTITNDTKATSII